MVTEIPKNTKNKMEIATKDLHSWGFRVKGFWDFRGLGAVSGLGP